MKKTLVTHLLAALVAGGLVYAVIAHKTLKKPRHQASLDFEALHEGGLILRDANDRNQTAVIHSDEGRARFKKDYPDVELRAGPEVLASRLLIVVFSDSLSGITVDRFWEASPCHYALDVRLLLTERRIGPPPANKKYSTYCVVAVDRSLPIANVGLRQATGGLCRQYGRENSTVSQRTPEKAKAVRGESEPDIGKPLRAALEKVLDLYAAGDARGLAKVASGRDRRPMWAAKDPEDPKQVERMKRFGGHMKKITPRWKMPSQELAIASFGPVSKAYHFRFVKKNGTWLLDDVNGGD